jgi:hypothetical protein
MTLQYLSGNRVTGLSSDTKPTTAQDKAVFYQTDDFKTFDFTLSSTTWTERSSGGAETHNFTSSSTFTPQTQTGIIKVTLDSNDVTAGSNTIVVDGVIEETITTQTLTNRIFNPSTSLTINALDADLWQLNTLVLTADECSSITGSPWQIVFKSDGTEFYVAQSTGSTGVIYQCSLTTAWDLSTAQTGSATSITFTGADYQYKDLDGIFLKPDGTHIYTASGTYVRDYTMSTAYDITTATKTASLDTNATSAENSNHSLFMNDTGTKLFVGGNTQEDVNQWDLSTPWDITTASIVGTEFQVPDIDYISSISINPDGDIMYLFVYDTLLSRTSLRQYTLTTPWLASTAVYVREANMKTGTGLYPQSVYVYPDGDKLFITETQNNKIHRYTLGSAFTGSALTTIG